MSLERTNVLSLPPVAPQFEEVADPSIEAWALAVEHALRFIKVKRAITVGAQTVAAVSIHTQDETVYGLKAYVLGRRTSGSGSLNDGYVSVLRGTARVISGTLTLIGSTTEFEVSDIAGADSVFALDGQRIVVNVTGAAGYDISWNVRAETLLGTH